MKKYLVKYYLSYAIDMPVEKNYLPIRAGDGIGGGEYVLELDYDKIDLKMKYVEEMVLNQYIKEDPKMNKAHVSCWVKDIKPLFF